VYPILCDPILGGNRPMSPRSGTRHGLRYRTVSFPIASDAPYHVMGFEIKRGQYVLSNYAQQRLKCPTMNIDGGGNPATYFVYYAEDGNEVAVGRL